MLEKKLNSNHFPYIVQRDKFAYAEKDYKDAEIVMFGAGYDWTSSNRAGSRFAPGAIRKESYLGMEEFSPYFVKEISQLPLHDLGDIEFLSGDKEDSLSRIHSTVKQIVTDSKMPFMLGGEHLVTLPAVQVLAKEYPDLKVIQLDAHLDLIDELYGTKLSHGTVMHRIYDIWEQKDRIIQAGIRSGSKKEFAFASQNTFLEKFTISGLPAILEKLPPSPLYFTLDLDVFDPSLIRGTGTPEAGGIFFKEFIELIKNPVFVKHKIVGLDVVELAPELDHSHSSTTITNQIIRELLCFL